jgi:DNA-binding response OmpR family regulator
MPDIDRRASPGADRRLVSRGGRRGADRPGCYPVVLVADGYAAARSSCVRFLDHYGFDVIEVGSGTEAIVALNSVRPHIILSGLDGADAERLYRWLRADETLRDRPVVVMAADNVALVPAENARVIMKPFSMHALLRDVREMLRATLRD